MTLIVEDGTGLYEANSYVGTGFVRDYLTKRNRAASWDVATQEQKDSACIAATDYVDARFAGKFKGQKLNTEISVASSNILQIRDIPADGDTVTIGDVTYTFRTVAAVAFDVAIGATTAEAAGALVGAIAGTGGGSGTTAHPSASGSVLAASGDVLVVALVPGVLAAPIATTSSSASLVWDNTQLIGGIDLTEQNLQWPRDRAYSRDGALFYGVPLGLKQAVAEYADRALIDTLMPDPVVDGTGGTLTYAREKLGPLETEYRYAGGIEWIFKKYPAADRLLADLLNGNGGVTR